MITKIRGRVVRPFPISESASILSITFWRIITDGQHGRVGRALTKPYRASLNLATGEYTDVETGIVYKTKLASDRYVLKMQREAQEGLEAYHGTADRSCQMIGAGIK